MEEKAINSPRSMLDYEIVDHLGEGSFAVVLKCIEKKTGNLVAIKVMNKRQVVQEKKVEYVFCERNIMMRLKQEYFIQLYCTFQDTQHLYFVLELAEGGDLLELIKKKRKLEGEEIWKYIRQLVIAVDYMHTNGVIHRDLKPENILLDSKGNIKISDFGSAKDLTLEKSNCSHKNGKDSRTERRSSFVGTAQYVCPELLTNRTCGKASDMWALGCIFYQMAFGYPPFTAQSEYLIFQMILKSDVQFPDYFDKDEILFKLIKALLKKDAGERMVMEDLKTLININS